MNKIKTFLLVLLCIILSYCSPKIIFNNTFQKYEKVKVGYGPEDFQLDTLKGNRLLISCDERREQKTQGSIWQYDLVSKKSEPISFEPEINFDFHPHGLHILTTNDTTYLFVINHIDKKSSEIDRFIVEEDKLILDKRFDQIIGSPNDIFALSKDEFYYTDYKTFGGSLVHLKQKAKKVVKHLKMPNGIYIENNEIYFSTTLNGKIYKTDIAIFKKKKLAKIKGGDNIMQYSHSELLVTSHQSFRKFLKHAKDANHLSPSLVYKLNKNTGEKEIIFYDNGKLIPAASTAFFFDGKLYLGQVFDNYILICE